MAMTGNNNPISGIDKRPNGKKKKKQKKRIKEKTRERNNCNNMGKTPDYIFRTLLY